jgi:hypothetical protein
VSKYNHAVADNWQLALMKRMTLFATVITRVCICVGVRVGGYIHAHICIHICGFVHINISIIIMALCLNDIFTIILRRCRKGLIFNIFIV